MVWRLRHASPSSHHLPPGLPPPPGPAGRCDSGTQRRTSRSCTAILDRQLGLLRSQVPL